MRVPGNSTVFGLLLTALTHRIPFLLTLLACTTPAFAQQTISVSFDFRNGSQGWEAGFADYPPATDNGQYQLQAEIRSLPPELGITGTGFYIQGANASDDLFMFLKRRLSSVDGVSAGQTYQINYSLVFASNAPTACGGIGGAPGESVYLRAGASPAEPLALLDSDFFHYLRLNIPAGKRRDNAIAASSTGNIANGEPCHPPAPVPFVSMSRSHQHTSLVNANSRGEIWLLVGADSGFEGRTSLYYQRIDVTLTPMSAPPPPVLLTEQNSGRAAAMDSVTLTRESFSVTSPHNFFSADHRTRVTLFAYYLELKNGEDISAIKAQAEDSQHRLYDLPVEAVNEVPKFGWISAVTVKLPDELQGAGDVYVKVSLRGVASNQALVSIN